MGHHHKLRSDKDCLNCGALVDDRFCPHCGQENIERRQPFHFLIGHFMEDLTHYDGQFWSTMKDLLFKPGLLTKTYLSGKRLKYVNPVKLYIFISFISFFLPPLIPDFSHKKHETMTKDEKKAVSKKKDDQTSIHAMKILLDKKLITKEDYDEYVLDMNNAQYEDSLKKLHPEVQIPEKYNYLDQAFLRGATNQEEYDKIQSKLPASKKNSMWYNLAAAKLFSWKEEGLTKDEMNEKWTESFVHNFPKVIFVYMPFFAFLLWLFENKKKFWYFDASIFTLHFFSFLLTSITSIIIMEKLFFHLDWSIFKFIFGFYTIATCIYTVRYFFKAHHRVFFQSRSLTFLKGVTLFFINCIFMIFFIVIYGLIIGYKIH